MINWQNPMKATYGKGTTYATVSVLAGKRELHRYGVGAFEQIEMCRIGSSRFPSNSFTGRDSPVTPSLV